jgi:hypothetical protein
MDKSDIQELKRLIDRLIHAPTKATGTPIHNRLNVIASHLSGKISTYSLEKLKESISFARSASGQGRDKDHWEKSTYLSWSVFEKNIKYEFEIL